MARPRQPTLFLGNVEATFEARTNTSERPAGRGDSHERTDYETEGDGVEPYHSQDDYREGTARFVHSTEEEEKKKKRKTKTKTHSGIIY